jgi:hypothetical protein
MARRKKEVKDCPVQLAIKHLQFAQYQDSRKKSAVAWVRKQRKQFDVAKLGVIDVSYRNKQYWVVDGMARVLLLKEVGGTHVWAVVNKGLTYEQEAKRFVVLNKERRKTTPFQEFYGEYEARVPLIVSVVKTAEKYGFNILKDAPGDGVIRCHSQVRRIIDVPNGLRIWDRTLNIIHTCWAGLPGALQNDLLRGLAFFIERHGDDPQVLKRLTQVLVVVHPSGIQTEAYLRRQQHTGNGGYKTTYTILREVYNKNAPVKLPCRLRTPLADTSRKHKAAAASQALFQFLLDTFKTDVRGPGFVFCRGGVTQLAKRLREVLGDQTAEQFAGAQGARLFRAYMRKQRQKLSPQFAVLCEQWGVKYQDLLLRKKKTKKAHKNNDKNNGRGSKKTGEVIFDAMSSKTVLELDTSV